MPTGPNWKRYMSDDSPATGTSGDSPFAPRRNKPAAKTGGEHSGEGLSDSDTARARKGKRIVQTPEGGYTTVDD